MIKSHLIEIIKTLKPEEVEDFKGHVFSKPNNLSSEQIEAYNLLVYILKFYPEFNSNELNKEIAFKNIYPNKKFIEGKIDKLLVVINKSLRNFLLIQKYLDTANEFQQLLDLSEIYKSRGLNARYLQTINQIDTQFLKNQKLSFDNSLNVYKFESEKHDWQSLYNKQNSDINLANTIKSLYVFYKTQMIELLNKFTIQQWASQLSIPEFISEVAASLETDPGNISEENYLLFILQKINNLITKNHTNTDEIDFISMFLEKNYTKFDPPILQLLYTYLRNICTIYIDRGVPNIRRTLFKMHKDHLQKGLLTHSGKITTNMYVSISFNAIVISELNWALNFIEEFKNKLIIDSKENIYYRLNISMYLFEKKQFEDALDNLVFSFPEIQFAILARRTEIKALYEINSELTSYKLDAYKMFINRTSHKSLPPAKKEHHLNFINLFSQIVQSIPGDKARAQKIIKRILAKKVVADRDWLLEKAREIGNLSDDEYAEAIKNPPTKE